MLYIGCPLWGFKGWVGGFFPEKTPASDFLRLYSRRLTAVEGNTTFYALPNEETIARWRQETPATFRICPKISRDISHTPRLDESKNATLGFVERMRGLRSRLGPIFLQLPPTFGPAQLKELQAFLDFWPQDIALAVEVRHPDFFAREHATALNQLLEGHNVARVLMDTRPIRTGSAKEQQMLQARERKPNLPLQIVTTADFAFVRYIGNPKAEVNEHYLNEWAKHIGQWLKQGRTLFIFCHCPFEEHSPAICATLYQKIRAEVPLPTLPWPSAASEEEPLQPRLF